jgi:hypothetical protein
VVVEVVEQVKIQVVVVEQEVLLLLIVHQDQQKI